MVRLNSIMKFPIPFTKMSGTGNDFILIDHRQPFIDKNELPSFAKAVCRRKFSAGADGLILIESSDSADFAWTFMNGDGSLAEMCGNGARCAARFAYEKKIASSVMRFQTMAGEIEAEVIGESVKIRMTPPIGLKLHQKVEIDSSEEIIHSMNTGVPHAVHFLNDNTQAPVVDWGREIRFHDLFQPAGTNVNFVEILSHDHLHVRTYERGVEDETMACGTGAVASAIIAAVLEKVKPPVKVTTSGGEDLIIHFTYASENIQDVYLEGPAHFIYEGQLNEEAVGF